MKILAIISLLSLFGCSAKGGYEYNSIVSYSKNEAIKFPDFTLEFTGTRDEKKMFPNGNSINFRFYDFKINTGSETKTISWSSGTGDIAPLAFEAGGKKFELELSNSESLKKKLSENELVIVKK